MQKYQTPIAILVLGGVIVAAHWVAISQSYYWYYSWLDIPMHFFGGMWVALLGLWFFLHSGYITLVTSPGKLEVVVIALLTTLLVGLFWEVFEFRVDTVFALEDQNDRGDTLLDLLMDIFGAIAAIFLYLFKRKIV